LYAGHWTTVVSFQFRQGSSQQEQLIVIATADWLTVRFLVSPNTASIFKATRLPQSALFSVAISLFQPRKMADPLSIAASIAGLISITVEAAKFLSPYVSVAKETP